MSGPRSPDGSSACPLPCAVSPSARVTWVSRRATTRGSSRPPSTMCMGDSLPRAVVSCRWMPTRFEVYLEVGAKRVFACAVDWRGWCRSGRDEATALQALLDFGPRYAAVVRSARLGFVAPSRIEALRVVERLTGNATTDFGAPGVIPSADRAAAGPAECARLEKVLRAGWRALD